MKTKKDVAALDVAIRNVIAYMWDDEMEDAQEQLDEGNGIAGNGIAGHVFNDLVAMRNHLDGTARDAESYLVTEKE